MQRDSQRTRAPAGEELCRVSCGTLFEVLPNEARAAQRAYELSKQTPCETASVMDFRGELTRLYVDGALYSPRTGEQLTPGL